MKLVIVDRDGVINYDRPDFVKTPAEWQPIPGSLEALVRLKQAGFCIVIASNQSGLARGILEYDALFAIHAKMTRMLAELGGQIDGIFFCPHAPEDHCDCRKPEIGMLEDIARRLGRAIDNAPFIGDKISDIQAAKTAGARPILVRTGDEVDTTDPILADVTACDDLAAAADQLIKTAAPRKPQRMT